MILTSSSASFSAAAALSFAEFAAKPFIQASVAQPMRTSSVLSFFYGVDLVGEEKQGAIEELKLGMPLKTMPDIWYQGGEEYDKLCRSFAPAVRVACEQDNDELQSDLSEVDHLMARMILCDQIARNAFRGDPEAFQYDEVSEKIAMQLTQHALDLCDENSETTLVGEMHPPYLMSCILPLMHSESIESHKRGKEAIDWAIDPENEYVPSYLTEKFEFTRGFLLDHTKVIERFGRYPHRNKAYGRESTEDEIEWLNNKDDLPNWAKSQ